MRKQLSKKEHRPRGPATLTGPQKRAGWVIIKETALSTTGVRSGSPCAAARRKPAMTSSALTRKRNQSFGMCSVLLIIRLPDSANSIANRTPPGERPAQSRSASERWSHCGSLMPGRKPAARTATAPSCTTLMIAMKTPTVPQRQKGLTRRCEISSKPPSPPRGRCQTQATRRPVQRRASGLGTAGLGPKGGKGRS